MRSFVCATLFLSAASLLVAQDSRAQAAAKPVTVDIKNVQGQSVGTATLTPAAKVYSRPIVTKVESFQGFYRAESYHQDYLKNNPDNPYIVYNDLPKLENLKKEFPGLYQP